MALAGMFCVALSSRGAAQSPPLAASPTPHEAPDEGRLKQARELFDEGLAAARGGRWLDARDAFERSLALATRPITLLNLAGVYAKTDELVQAAAAYRQFLQQAGGGPEAKYQNVAQKALADVEQRTPRLRLRLLGLQKTDTLRLDDIELPDGRTEMEVPVNPGSHVVTVQRARLPALRSKPVVLAEQEVAEVLLDARLLGYPSTTNEARPVAPLAAKTQRRKGWRSPWLWTFISLAVAGGITTAVVLTVRQRDDGVYEGSLPPGSVEITLPRPTPR